MNLIDAAKSGLPFRRPKWLNWVDHAEVKNFAFSVEDLTADDYYLNELKVTITRTRLLDAYEKAWQEFNNAPIAKQSLFEDYLLKELGL